MGILRRVTNLWRRARLDADIDEELRSHLEMATEDAERAGMPPEEARRVVRLRFGNVLTIRERTVDADTAALLREGALMETVLMDLKQGARVLRRSPGFALTAVLTIGLGIGANSAMFSVINGVIRKPLRYPDSERLMFISTRNPARNLSKFYLSPPEYFEFKERTRAFSGVAAYRTDAVNVSEGERPERVHAAFVSANMFSVLGVNAERGQLFTAEQDTPHGEPVVVLSHDLWQRMFGSNDSIVGRRIQIEGRSRRVLGVMPAGFDIHDNNTQVWVPLGEDPANRRNRGWHYLYLVGRLAPSVSEVQARGEITLMLKHWRQWVPYPHVPNDSTHLIQMAPLRDEVVGNVRKALWMLQGAVALVLLVACANVANLLLARAESRHKEFAVRSALGASRTRILRQFISEGVILSVLGAALGLAIAFWGLEVLLASNPVSVPRSSEITLDPMVLIFTVAIAAITGIVFGLAPLLHLSDRSVGSAIKDGASRTTSNAGRNHVRQTLVAVEIALAVMLVIGAGLLLKSFRNLTSVDAGFSAQELITFGVALPRAAYPDSQRQVEFFDELQSRLAQIPGVERVAAMSGLPPDRELTASETNFEGYTYMPGSNEPIPSVDFYQFATVGYFETMGIAIRQGRPFNETDAAGAPVAIINEALAERFYQSQNPVGRRLRPAFGANTPWFTIVGVAKDVKQRGLEADVGTEVYFDYAQLPRTLGFMPPQMNVVLRSSRPLDAIATGIRRTVKEADPALPVMRLRTMEDVFGESVTRQRFLSMLLGAFAVVALILAAIGTYGILAYMVNERQREIGIRMALGADRTRVVSLVLRQGLTIAGIGILVGVSGALLLSRLTTTLLYGVKPSDPATFATVVVVIAAVALAACVVPMHRATRVDPLRAMRAD